MANLLAEPQNIFYHDYKINVCAGTRAGIGIAALAPVQESMHDPLHSKTMWKVNHWRYGEALDGRLYASQS